MIRYAEFEDVSILPLLGIENHVPIGGPFWPDFVHQSFPRYCRDGRPIDGLPDVQWKVEESIEDICWGGVIHPEFGHFLAEHATRVLPSILAFPDLKLAFIAPFQDGELIVPSYAYQIFDWFGLERKNLLLISRPTVAKRLRVFEQGEMLGRKKPVQPYLDMLDSLAIRKGYGNIPRDIEFLYVGRQGLLKIGRGGHLGEQYLEDRLRTVGATVIDPSKLPISAVLEFFWRSQKIIFAEGSTLHLRQLLGRIDQEVFVLKRRPASRIARSQITSRSKSVSYFDVSKSYCHLPTNPNGMRPGKFRLNLSVSFYDPDLLFNAMSKVGLNLRSEWNNSEYLDCANRDLRMWKEARNEISPGSDRKIVMEEISI